MRKDDSVSFSATTPELTDDELSAFRQVSKVVCNVVIEPQGGSSGVLEIKERVDGGKSPGQRLRASMFVWWNQLNKPGDDFENFYRIKMELLIEMVKGKLE